MNIFIGLLLLSVGTTFGYLLCALLSANSRRDGSLEFTTTVQQERKPNYLIIHKHNKMIAVYYDKELNWFQTKILKWFFNLDIKKLSYDFGGNDDD